MTVDDSTSMRRLLAFFLRHAGYEVVEAADGIEALSALQGSIHLFLLDLNMPKMDGIELTRYIRSSPEYRFVPIVLLSGDNHGERFEQGKEAGATGWIEKPFEPEHLLAVVDQMMGAAGQ